MSAEINTNSDAKIVYLDPDAKAQRKAALAQLPKPVSVMRDKAQSLLSASLKLYFDQVDDALFEMADRAENNERQAVFFDAMREARVQRCGFEMRFAAAVDDAFALLVDPDSILKDNAQAPSIKADALTLVQKDELEEMVAIDAMEARAMSDCSEAVQLLSLRLDSIMPNRVYIDNNPLGPKTLCTVFKNQATCLDIDIKAKLVMFKLFEKRVVSGFANLYDEANKVLIDQGVLPSLSVRQQQRTARRPEERIFPVRNAPFQPSSAQPSTAQHSPVQPSAAHSASYQNGSFQNQPAQGLGHMQSQPDASPHMLSALAHILGDIEMNQQPYSSDAAQYGEAQGLLTLLSSAQRYAVTSAHAPINVSHLLTQLQREGAPSARVGRTDQEVINLVELLFEFVLEDRNLPSAMKAVISRLQIPMVKVAIMDKTFFTHSAHSARRLLNQMASVAIGWEDRSTKEGRSDPLLEKMNHIVQSVLSNFDSNLNVFDQLLEDFTAFLAAEKRRASVLEKRTLAAEDGKAKAEIARSVVAVEIELRLIDRGLPESVLDLVQSAWSDYLFLTGLKHGFCSSEWSEGLKTLDFLVWSAMPSRTNEHSRKLIKLIPKLTKRLRMGLESISFDPFKLANMLKSLEDVHLAAISRKQIAVKYVEVQARKESAPIVAEEQAATSQTDLDSERAEVSGCSQAVSKEQDQTAKEAASKEEGRLSPQSLPADDPQMQQVQSFVQGAWFDMHDDNDKPQRCRFAAYIRPTSKYIFVNRGGMKVAEKSQVELALALKAERLRALDNSMLFDRALETVVTALNKSNDKTLS